ncbi:hypothetical protein, partial [Methanosarcina sp.]|uniref:hypothetical protein n=1 Tax=Methanosarcina sp. TaxID=2213 RepID=UPI00298830D1
MIKLFLAQPLGRNRWAATVAPVDHAVTKGRISCIIFAQAFLKKACDHAVTRGRISCIIFAQAFLKKACDH